MNTRLPRLLRLRSFWLGLPVFFFLLWAWGDSMIHAVALHREYGTPTHAAWPPIEAVCDLQPQDPELRPVPVAEFDLAALSPYAAIDAEVDLPRGELMTRWMIMTDSQPEWARPLPWDDPGRWKRARFAANFKGYHYPSYYDSFRAYDAGISFTEIRGYRSAGSHAGALWSSSWRTPQQMPAREYLPAATGQGWFPAPEWGEEDLLLGRTLRLPYWLLAGAYLAAWGILMGWRLRLRARAAERSALLALEARRTLVTVVE